MDILFFIKSLKYPTIGLLTGFVHMVQKFHILVFMITSNYLSNYYSNLITLWTIVSSYKGCI